MPVRNRPHFPQQRPTVGSHQHNVGTNQPKTQTGVDKPAPNPIQANPPQQDGVDQRRAGQTQNQYNAQQQGAKQPNVVANIVGGQPSKPLHLQQNQGRMLDVRPSIRAGDWQRVDVQSLKRPADLVARAPQTERFAIGQTVECIIRGETVKGKYDGFDFRGRPVVADQNGQRRIADWQSFTPTGNILKPQSSLQGLSNDAIVAAPVRLRQAVEAALDLKVVGKHTAREYIDAFHKSGYEVFIAGGAIRDAIRLLHTNPQASNAEVLALLNDVDIVTTAPPPDARQLCEKLAPELKQGGVWSPPFVEQFGVVLAGGKKAGMPDTEGLDICSMKVANAHSAQMIHPDTNENAFPATFGRNIAADAGARDFTCNAVYYDPLNHVVVDPTLRGIADAEQQVLHLAQKIENGKLTSEDKSASPRFWKFRLRGYDTDRATLRLVRQHAEKLFRPTDGKARWELCSSLGRVAPKDCKDENDVHQFLMNLKYQMQQDGCGDLYRDIIHGGTRQMVIRETLKRTLKGQ